MVKPVVGVCSLSLFLAAAAGAQTLAGPEFRVNTYTTGRQYFARPAMEPDGDFVVVWSAEDGSYERVLGQRFAASGAPRGAEFQINLGPASSRSRPVVSVGSDGSFVVVWASSPAAFVGQLYDASGSAIGGQLSYFDPNYSGNEPRVARAPDGGFVVSWTRRNGLAVADIAAGRFDAVGDPIGLDFMVNTYTTSNQGESDVAVAADGSFVVVWTDNNPRDGSGVAVMGQRFDASATPLGGEFLVNTYSTGYQRWPSVSLSPAGGFVVVWWGPGAGDADGVFGRRFDASGTAVGSEFVASTVTTGTQYGFLGQVSHDALGNFVVTWAGQETTGFEFDTFAQRFSASGARRGAEFRVNSYTTGNQGIPSVVSDAVGNFVVTWRSFGQDGSDWGVFAQRFGGLRPAALRADVAGNRVLDPGETAELRPTWRNDNGAAQAFGGTLSTPTGPPGGVPQLVDATADYGTVPNGAAGECTGCYTVLIPNPSPRPVVHWDATVRETIVPDTHGQQKAWLLHVGDSFTDVPRTSAFYRFVETLLHHGVTGGCGATQYCPASSTTRDQMAVFVLVAKEGPGFVPPACGATPMFADVPAGNPFCRWIEELARRAVVSGCGGGNYCPASAVTREQMAVFVLRTLDPALNPPACTTPVYNDVSATSGFCRWIEELTRRSIVTGCGGGNYCPAAPVTREQMGVFIGVTFGLTLYGP